MAVCLVLGAVLVLAVMTGAEDVAVAPGATPTAVPPGPAVVPGLAPAAVAPGPVPAAVAPGPASAAVVPGPASAAVAPGPVPAAVVPGPASAAVAPGPVPAAVVPGPASTAVAPGPVPAAVVPGPVPAAVAPGPALGAVAPGIGSAETPRLAGPTTTLPDHTEKKIPDTVKLNAEPDALQNVVGGPCRVAADCSAANHTDCVDGGCRCKAGYVQSKQPFQKCLKVSAGLGAACEQEDQCSAAVPGAECADSQCRCPPYSVFDQNRCWHKQMLGGVCSSTLQCEDVAHAVCEQSVCACLDPLIPSTNNKCLMPAGSVYAAPCEEDIQCSHSYGDEARCRAGQCACTSTYHYDGEACVPNKRLGDECGADEQCAVVSAQSGPGEGPRPGRLCVNGACACADGYEAYSGEDICTKSAAEELAVSLSWVLCIAVAKYFLT